MQFVAEGFVGHLSYILLIVSSLMRRMFLLRVFMVASALAGIFYDWFWLDNPVGVFWEGLLLIVTAYQIWRIYRADARARFSAEESDLCQRWFPLGPPNARRALLDLGRWETLDVDHLLTEQGKRPATLTYIAEGAAQVVLDGDLIARVTAGQFVGDMSLIGDDRATADVRLATPARVWRIDRDRLDTLREGKPEIYALVDGAVALGLREKLVSGNLRSIALRAANSQPA